MLLRNYLHALLLTFLGSTTPILGSRINHVLHEKRIDHPTWMLARRLEPNVILPLRIGLKQRNLDRLPAYLMSVSDPESPSYGQHWTPEQVVDAFAPPHGAGETVRRWLMAAGFEARRIRQSPNKSWINVQGATTSEVEQLLNARYHVFKREDGSEHVACDSYSLPRHISDVVDIITPTVQAHNPLNNAVPNKTHRVAIRRDEQTKRAVVDTGAPIGCDELVTPDCLRALYNMTYVPQATDRNTFGIVSYYSLTYLQSDLDAFFRNFSPSLVGKSPQLVSIDGGTLDIDETSDIGEDALILQHSMTLVQPQPVMLLQIGNQQTGEFRSFNEWLDAVDGSYCTSDGGDDFTYDPQLPNPLPGGLKEHSCGVIKPPNVVSNSQAVEEYKFSPFYLQRQCNEFAKLGLMGVTVLYSAGNTGVASVTGPQAGYCLDENGSMNLNATNFNPAWPASCPWVTAVGGTQVKANATARPGVEEVWNQDLTSGFFESGGGGFSVHFPTPNYQKQAVETFLQNLKKSDPAHLKHFNVKGRAYPDLSANANMFLNIQNGSVSADSGTSGATPTVASIITLVNDARIAAGKKPVGFINPTIYSPNFAGAFNDITSGTNQGCKGLQGDRGGGFKAGKGWDPASGVGSPNLGILIDKWLALP